MLRSLTDAGGQGDKVDEPEDGEAALQRHRPKHQVGCGAGGRGGGVCWLGGLVRAGGVGWRPGTTDSAHTMAGWCTQRQAHQTRWS